MGIPVNGAPSSLPTRSRHPHVPWMTAPTWAFLRRCRETDARADDRFEVIRRDDAGFARNGRTAFPQREQPGAASISWGSGQRARRVQGRSLPRLRLVQLAPPTRLLRKP